MKLKVIGTDGASHPVSPARLRGVDLADGFHLDEAEIEVVKMLCQGIKFQDACNFARLFDQASQESLYEKVGRLGLN